MVVPVAAVVVVPVAAVVELVSSVTGVSVPPSLYQQIIFLGGLVGGTAGGHHVTAVVVGETKQAGLCSPSSSL